MAITTDLSASRLAAFSSMINEKKANVTLSETSKKDISNNSSAFSERLTSSLQKYAQSWHDSLQSLGPLIDTTPAQVVLKATQPLLASRESTLQSDYGDTISDWEIYEDICNKLGYMQTHYMDVYAQVTEQYQLYMEDVNSFKASLTNYMDNGADEIKLDIPGILNEVDKVIDKWSVTPLLTVTTKEEADYWQDQLGLPYTNGPEGYSFYVNLTPMYDIRDSVTKLSSTVSTARFNQWQNSVNSACSTIESDTQIIAQKYSQANTVFNNLAKILSSTMDALYQTDKEFLRN
ncbi:IpaD/SipD/SspD family type III secretion system needle tip protein [Lelliottia sp. WAP21]|uniref:IpaD/SipD/SspD family type III secretion system needle tip protein n=1 Tax=Lelliottia sp. WAP21 TaxID=2877426 RepID=UPI001E534B23|nr:IpaD/SipD/SspD family type III secretion system needle tip protein [Lelliottia sp. WAP21]